MHWKFWSHQQSRIEDQFDYIQAELDKEHWQPTEESRDALIRRVQQRFGLSKAVAASSVSSVSSRTKSEALAYIQRELEMGSWLSTEEDRDTLILSVQRHCGLGKELDEATAAYFVNTALSLHKKPTSE